jgi:hypothetical protein
MTGRCFLHRRHEQVIADVAVLPSFSIAVMEVALFPQWMPGADG